MESKKAVCENRRCRWHGTMDDVLRGPDPFDPEEQVIGCPRCRGVECLLTACDEPSCWKPATCGTPTAGGYRHTCGEHKP